MVFHVNENGFELQESLNVYFCHIGEIASFAKKKLLVPALLKKEDGPFSGINLE
jgi:hypothetical protein